MGVGSWTEMPLGEFAPFVYGKGLAEKKRDSRGEIPVFGSNGQIGRHTEALVPGPGVIIGRKGTVGSVSYSAKPFWPIDTTFFVPEAEHRDIRFTYYLLKSLRLEKMNSDSAVPGLNRDAAHSVQVSVPPLPEQRRIAHILGTLDDKIELNRRMNATLEAIARALFKSWFVDFDPVHAKAAGRRGGLPPELEALFPDSFADSELGPIPAGWEVKALDEIADFLNGLALQKYPPKNVNDILPVIKIRELRQGYSPSTDFASTDIDHKYVINDGDILFSWSGNLLAKFWTEGTGALNQHLFKVTSENYPEWFYYFWLQSYMPEFQAIAAGKATTMGHIQRHHLSAALCSVPTMELLAWMTKKIQPLVDLWVSNNVQSRKLAEIQGGLLPRFMEGIL